MPVLCARSRLHNLPAISSIASTQVKATEETERRVKQLPDYLATLPNTKARFYVSKMVLNVHSDASYLSEPGAKSRAARRQQALRMTL